MKKFTIFVIMNMAEKLERTEMGHILQSCIITISIILFYLFHSNVYAGVITIVLILMSNWLSIRIVEYFIPTKVIVYKRIDGVKSLKPRSINRKIKKQFIVYGALNPHGFDVPLSQISHKIIRVYGGCGFYFAKVEVLDTPSGKLFKSNIRGVKIVPRYLGDRVSTFDARLIF